MLTVFPEALHEDIHRCVNCGFCQQVCPTYKVTRRESEAPRGRVQIVKHYLDGKLQAHDLQKVMADCIGCDACAAFCLSGVRIDRIFQNIRRELGGDVRSRIEKKLLGWALGSSGRLCAAAALGRGCQNAASAFGVSRKVGNIPFKRLPKFNKGSFRKTLGEVVPAEGKRMGRIAYFTGCATDLMYEDVGHSVLHILRKLGIEVVIPRDQVCCGAPLLLKGGWEQVLPNIAKNLQAFDRDDVDAIVVDCGTCGSALKKAVPELLADLGLDAAQAKRVAAKVKDISEVVVENIDRLPLRRPPYPEELTVTYHDSCHLTRGMGVTAPPRKIFGALEGVRLIEMQGAGECCGGGGAYQFENPKLSGGITGRKVRNIRDTDAQSVVTGCPGCRMTLSG
ncbi:MAG: (Fe-S)-binding protein, partial [Deltaproteobacteria bacterium]|nr:(Fe-S)-binding protein [Deltaproteobacteria bacterium]